MRDPVREADYGEAFEPRDAALDAALRDDFAATAPVYGDWLAERGHPRGELAAMPPEPPVPEDPEAIMPDLATAADRFALAHHLLDPFAGTEPGTLRAGSSLRWEHGFVRRADYPYGIGDLDSVFELLRHPSMRALAALTIGTSLQSDLRDMIALFVTCEAPPPLEVLGRRGMFKVPVGDALHTIELHGTPLTPALTSALGAARLAVSC